MPTTSNQAKAERSKLDVERLSEAVRSGAKVSLAVVFFAAGGSSRATTLAWPGDGLRGLDTSRGRAEAMVQIEDAMPGWTCSFSSLPCLKDSLGKDGPQHERERGSKVVQATLKLSPFDRGDEAAITEAGRGGAESSCAAALDALDAFVGGASLRGRYEGSDGWSSVDGPWNLVERQASFERLFGAAPPWAAGGLALPDFIGAVEACAVELDLRGSVPAGKASGFPHRV